MPYFRYSFLNSLRDELGLTMTWRKVTLFHFLYLAIPGMGLGAGIGWGRYTRCLWEAVIGSLLGIVVGGVLAWAFPRLLWGMFRVFVRKGWFLQPAHPHTVPVMTSDEFVVRSNALCREGSRLTWVSTGLFILGAFGFSRLFFYFDNHHPNIWVQVLAVAGFIIFLVGYLPLHRRMWKRLVRKHGLQCPACSREITDAAGLSRLPHMGLCRHCGTQVIEV